MPQQQGNVGGVLKGLGNKVTAAIAANKDNETSYGIQNLPPGIMNGVAKITECKFGVYQSGVNQGQPYFRASGSVISPEAVTLKDGSQMSVRGLYTSIMIGITERKDSKTGKTIPIDDAIDKVMNELRKLGADTSKLKGPEDLERLAAAVKQAAPLFKFSTSVRQGREKIENGVKTKEPDGVWENWHGTKGLENFGKDEDAGAGTDDDTGASDNADSGDTDTGDAGGANNEYSDQEDLDSLGARAEEGDEEARNKLEEFAKQAGLTKKQLDAIPTWIEVANRIKEGGESGGGGDDTITASSDGPTPEKGNIFDWVAPSGKVPGKKGKNKVEIEVVAVNATKKTVDGRWTQDKKTVFKDIPWSDLIGE